MLVNLQNTVHSEYEYYAQTGGVITATEKGTCEYQMSSVGAQGEVVIFGNTAVNGAARAFVFLIAPGNFPGNQWIQQALSATGDRGDFTSSGNSVFDINAGNALDAPTAATTAGNNITTAYNQLYGTSKTNAEVYQILLDRYQKPSGTCFFYAAAGSQLTTFMPMPLNSANGMTVLSGRAANYQLAYSKVENGPYAVTNTDVVFNGESYEVPETANTWLKLYAALIFGEYVPKEEISIDLYVNGGKGPNIEIEWTETTHGAGYDTNNMTVSVWEYPTAFGSEQEPLITDQSGIVIPNDGQWYVRKNSYNFPDTKYADSYLGAFGAITSGLSSIEKVILYGIDGIANSMHYYVRVDYEGMWSKIGDFFIPYDREHDSDCTVIEVANSDKNPNWRTVFNIHFGTSPDDDPDYDDPENDTGDDIGVYDPDNPPDITDITADNGLGYDGTAVLTKSYAMTAAVLQNIGTKLWTQSYYDVLKIQNNPIENVVAVKAFPFTISGTSTEVKIGDIAFGINGDLISSMKKITVGSTKFEPFYGNFLDGSPYTVVKLRLPYIGEIQLDASTLINRTVGVDYVIDLVTGECMAIITVDGIPYYNASGRMGVDIPLTSTDRTQTELKAAQAGITGAASAAGQLISGDGIGAAVSASNTMLTIAGMDYTCQRSANQSAACASFENHQVMLIVERPIYQESNGYKHLKGYPCHKYLSLSSLSGFAQIDSRTDIQIAMTQDENRMLEELLTQGIYI